MTENPSSLLSISGAAAVLLRQVLRAYTCRHVQSATFILQHPHQALDLPNVGHTNPTHYHALKSSGFLGD